MLDHCLNNQATTLRGRLKYIVKKKVFAHFVFIFCTFRFCDYTLTKKSLLLHISVNHLLSNTK